MSARNVDVRRSELEAFNRGDLDAVVSVASDSIRSTDHARGLVLEGREKLMGWLAEWKHAFSDARATDIEFIDAGEYSISRFTAQGTNDGPLGPFPPTGRRMRVPMCTILRHDSEGDVVEGAVYHDQLTILTQLGHASFPERNPASV